MSGVADYSSTPASNTTINSIGIQGTNNVQNFDNAFRQLMADIATARTDGQMASMPYLTKSATYTVAVTDRGKLIDCTAALELDLPAAATAGAAFYFIAKANGGAVTLDPNGTENINGSSTSATVADGASAIVACNGTAWFTVSIGSGDVTTTGTQTLTNKTLTAPTLNSPVIGTGIELGHATDTTLTRSAAGVMAVESNVVPSPASQAAGDILYRGASSWSRLAKGTASQRLRMNSGATAPEWTSEGLLTLDTAQATTSGTAFDFTIPSWAKRIDVIFNGVSLSGTDHFLIQLGDSGGIETTGYESSSFGSGNTSTSTSGFIIRGANAATRSGNATLLNPSGNIWVASTNFGGDDATANGGGNKTLSAALTTVRITRTGTNTFDAGLVNVIYE